MKRCYSLKRNKEFRYVYRTGKTVTCRCLVLIYRKNKSGLLHIGLSVSKKNGNSVTRNLIKRRLRSALDRFIPELNPNYNLIVIARRPILDTSFEQIGDSFAYMFKKAGLIEKDVKQTSSNHSDTENEEQP